VRRPPLRKAAERCLSNISLGQICTTVDYAHSPAGKMDEFASLKKLWRRVISHLDTPDYTYY
jgi:hypothetical protein